ncbi:hypothetical protein B0I35DRAFT_440775 [Stachybotrys elegans]|uniref:Rhodopsin domain-containing protein n=1 Tax=Stachybotrys elegans TaxID=80388 RepID=A0A8K0SJP3_9HYPO|nr:hypothetical protein B0I35DRAFT_440775 [Stachybotrys elegans]
MNRDTRNYTVSQVTPYSANGIFAGNMALYTAKLPLLFLYMRTFGLVKWLRHTAMALVVVGGISFIATAVYASVTCSPALHRDEFPPAAFFTCIVGITNACMARGSISLIMDVIMFILPLPVIKGLNMPFRRKAGLAFVFMAGLLAIVASAVSLYFQDAQQRGGSSDNFANALVLTVIESAIVILVSCAPALHLFWSRQSSGLFSRLGLTHLSGKSSDVGSARSNNRLSRYTTTSIMMKRGKHSEAEAVDSKYTVGAVPSAERLV